MSTTLEKLLDKLTALEQYEATLVETPQVSSVDQLAQVGTTLPPTMTMVNSVVYTWGKGFLIKKNLDEM